RAIQPRSAPPALRGRRFRRGRAHHDRARSGRVQDWIADAMDPLMLVCATVVAWLPGVAMLVALRRPGPLAAGEGAWIAGAGYLVGAFLLTLWMRVLSRFDVAFGAAVIAVPLVVGSLAVIAYAWRRDRFDARVWPARLLRSIDASDLPKWERVLWLAL